MNINSKLRKKSEPIYIVDMIWRAIVDAVAKATAKNKPFRLVPRFTDAAVAKATAKNKPFRLVSGTEEV